MIRTAEKICGSCKKSLPLGAFKSLTKGRSSGSCERCAKKRGEEAIGKYYLAKLRKCQKCQAWLPRKQMGSACFCPDCQSEFAEEFAVANVGLPEQKRCYLCACWKDRTEFATNRTNKDNLQNGCRACYNPYMKINRREYLARMKKDNPAKYKKLLSKASKANTDTARAWVGANPARARTIRRAYRYGITHEQMKYLEDRSEGRCEICGTDCGMAKLNVDHDHLTKEVRGLLCHRCNVGIGFFQDSEAILRTVIAYLRREAIPKTRKGYARSESAKQFAREPEPTNPRTVETSTVPLPDFELGF